MIELNERITDCGIWVLEMDLASRAQALGKKGSSQRTIARNMLDAGFNQDKDAKGRVLWFVPNEHLAELVGVVEWHAVFMLPDGTLDHQKIDSAKGGILNPHADYNPADAEQLRTKCEVLSAKYDEMSDTCRTQADKLLEYESKIEFFKKQVAEVSAERDAERLKSAELRELIGTQKDLLTAAMNNSHPELADDVAAVLGWVRQHKPIIDEWKETLPKLAKRVENLESEVKPDEPLDDEVTWSPNWVPPKQPGLTGTLRRVLRIA
jgi:hypothetical protein